MNLTLMKALTDNAALQIGTFIRNLRKERNLTQRELAQLAGVSFSFVNQVEGGKQTLRLDTLNKLFCVFDYKMSPTRMDRSQHD